MIPENRAAVRMRVPQGFEMVDVGYENSIGQVRGGNNVAQCFHVRWSAANTFSEAVSGASPRAVGRVCMERRVCWKHQFFRDLTVGFQRQDDGARRNPTPHVTINIFELVGMHVRAVVMFHDQGDEPMNEVNPISLKGDNGSMVSWNDRCEGAKNKRASVAS